MMCILTYNMICIIMYCKTVNLARCTVCLHAQKKWLAKKGFQSFKMQFDYVSKCNTFFRGMYFSINNKCFTG